MAPSAQTDSSGKSHPLQLAYYHSSVVSPLQLHTYVYIVPTIPDSSVTSLGADGNHTPLTGRYDNTSVTHRDVDNFSSTTLGIGSDQTNNLHSSNSGM